MDAIGDARSSPAPAEMLDAIALLQASGVGSADRSEDARSGRVKRSASERTHSRALGMNGSINYHGPSDRKRYFQTIGLHSLHQPWFPNGGNFVTLKEHKRHLAVFSFFFTTFE